jgi:hypothetical protein
MVFSVGCMLKCYKREQSEELKEYEEIQRSTMEYSRVRQSSFGSQIVPLECPVRRR